MGFQAAISEKPRSWVVLSCAEHLVSPSLGEIKQPCPRSLLSEVSCEDFFESNIFAREDLNT